MSDGGKGSQRRPTNEEAYRSAWDRIFKKGNSSSTQDAQSVAPVTQEQSIVMVEATVSPATQQQESNNNQ